MIRPLDLLRGRHVAVVLLAWLGGCVGEPNPPSVLDDSGTSGTTSDPSTTGIPTPPSTATGEGTGATGEGSGTTHGDTTAGPGTGSSTGASGESSSGGPPIGCVGDAECGANEVCDDTGQCVAACMPWGMGSYDYCLNDYGGFDTPGLCGVGHQCVYVGNPIQAAGCMLQACGDACECPGPAATGDATVTCADVTGDGQSDCHLSCAAGETCPDGMTCMNGTFCMTETPAALPMYGNCGAVDATCDNGTCSVLDVGGDIYSLCVTLCFGGTMDCDAAPPGATLECDGVISPPMGPDCHLDCNAGICPDGMVCINPGGTMDDLCMWPPL